MKEILVVYYSQSGQLKNLLTNILKPLSNNEYHITYKNIEPVKKYNFPWSSDEFFDVMPESVLGINCELKHIDFEKTKYDLIILAYQVWYLSPSIPFWSFLNEKKYSKMLENTKVLTVIGARNMWIMAHKNVSIKLRQLQANHIGNIVFVDKHNNLISVLTIMKWMFTGEKGPYKNLPNAGVSNKEIVESEKYGNLITEAFKNNTFGNLQTEIVKIGGVPINFALKISETNAKRIFNIWANKILSKGKAGNTNRLPLIRIFKYYLIFLIFAISPIATILFTIVYYLFYPLTSKNLKRTSLLKDY